MNKGQIVAISIDKVQSFLTETIHAHVQEKQTEEATLKYIRHASWDISNNFYGTIKKEFSETETNIRELMSCSGVYIFSCTLSEADIKKKLDQLFVQYYCSSQGQKLLKCTSFPAEGYDNLQAIQEAKKRLKQSKCLNERIEKSKDILFSFCAADETGAETVKEEKDFPLFAKDINALFSKEEADNENHFRIAVIKADLDGMGALFKEIQQHEIYKKVSTILNKEVSLDGLHNSMEKCRLDGATGWLFPFYIAGDDIFFAVSVANLITGIDVCREILRRINAGLENLELKRGDQPIKLSMSIGVEITFNREPIRYYMEMVERQLKKAKETDTVSLQQFVLTKISIGGLTYLDINYEAFKRYKKDLKCRKKEKANCNCENCEEKRTLNRASQAVPIWNFFLHDVYRLNDIRTGAYNQLLGTPGFFYTLLERLTDKTVQQNDTQYINIVLYHLLPQYMNGSDPKLKELELLLYAGILKQLLKKGKHGMELVLEKQTKHRLENYLRLMLLFCDSRFHLTKGYDANDTATPQKLKKTMDESRKYLLTKSTDYLFDKILLAEENKALTEIFVRKVDYEVTVDGKKSYRKCFQRLNIEKSMFVKLRNTMKVTAEKAAAMIVLRNGNPQEYVEKLNLERVKAGKVPYHLYFDQEQFKIRANNNTWHKNFVDSMMLLYAYIEMAISYKKQINNILEEKGDSK